VRTNTLISHLRELRDVKFRLASRAFKRYYDSWCSGRHEESKVIRCGALRELKELFTIEEWIATLTGGVDCTMPRSTAGEIRGRRNGHVGANELRERCRVLRLVNQRLTEWRGNGMATALRTFLAQLAAEEAGRVNALLSKNRIVG
jgi:hypothetical protein